MHPTTFVAAGAVIVGDVTLSAGSGVWFNTVVRADSAPVELGEQSNLQDNTVVHEDEGLPTRIGARVTVGHRCIIHGCVIEDECLIGMGSVVLSGARIGAGSLIGAGALVREGQVIPPGSLAVGAPARVVGPVSENHRKSIANGWSHYAELARDYMEHGHVRHLDRSWALVHDLAPMDDEEWWSSIQRFERLPGRLASWMASRSEVAGGYEIVSLLAARDRLQREPVLRHIEEGQPTTIEDLAPRPAGVSTDIQEWTDIRRRLVDALDRLGPRHGGRAAHPTRGPFTVPELLRDWIEEDRETWEVADARRWDA